MEKEGDIIMSIGGNELTDYIISKGNQEIVNNDLLIRAENEEFISRSISVTNL